MSDDKPRKRDEAHDPDEERIRRKAYELWLAEGRPEGRDRDHWELARELIAIEDSQKTTLRPPPRQDEEPVEPPEAFENQADVRASPIRARAKRVRRGKRKRRTHRSCRFPPPEQRDGLAPREVRERKGNGHAYAQDLGLSHARSRG